MDVGVHVLRPVDRDLASLLRRTGFQSLAVHLSWRWANKLQPNWDLSSVDHFLEPFRAAELPLQGLLGPGFSHLQPDWLLRDGAGDHPDYTRLFAESCARLAAAVPDITVFRVEDELNGAWLWDGLRTRRRRGRAWRDPAFRLDVLRSALSAVREARPDAQLIVTVNATLPGWKRALRRWLRAGLQFDRLGLSLDPCRLLPDPAQAERVVGPIEQAIKLLQAEGHPASVELSRLAYTTTGETRSPRRQREFFAQAARAASQAGAVGLVAAALRDQSWDDPMLGYWVPERERFQGLLYYDGTPKPVLEELRVLATGDRFGEGG